MAEQIIGLTEAEALARRGPGRNRHAEFPVSRTYFEILRRNAFTFINSVLFGISLLLVLLGQVGDALVTAGLVFLNVAVGVFQEARAKRALDKIALLARPTAAVVRDGMEKNVDPGEVVPGDILSARPGDQIVVDGSVVDGRGLEVDESLLSGESARIAKGTGDAVFSGSFCVAGTAYYRAEKVGAESLIRRMTAGARAFRQVRTPLQRDINLLIRVIVLLVGQIGILFGISFAMEHLPLVESVRMAAVIVALVPQGLFFMTTVAYAMGAVRVAGKGALIQQANAVESLSSVNLLCLDKTGTLTTNRIRFHSLYPLAGAPAEAELRSLLADFAASASGGNRTLAAIQEAMAGEARRIVDEAPFASERRWSALAFDDPARRGTYALGAPEILSPRSGAAEWEAKAEEWTSAGVRVLLLARHPGSPALHDAEGRPSLPSGFLPLCLIGFLDELRPEAAETLSRFRELGIEPKIISGDDPQTVAALYRQVASADPAAVLSGPELAALSGSERKAALDRTTVFGRITPQQKEELVRDFQRRGRYVAMIGDGVNDVLSLKQAEVGIAMQSGSAAARSVADIVLLDDSFAALPTAFREGQRIVKGMEDVVRLLLTRTFYVLLLVVATQFVGAPFPITPKHNALLALLTVGIPILAIAAWARPGPSPRRILQAAFPFVLPGSFLVSILALAVYLTFLALSGDINTARSALTTVTVLCGLVLIVFVEPPNAALAGGDTLSGDRRPTVLALGMLAAFAVILAAPGLRAFFEMTLLGWSDYLLLVGLVAGWAFLLRAAWRANILERLLKT
jgi:cation-transporting ATPase E